MKYSITQNGTYWSIQGEGHLRGQQMAFVRLAGCSVGCKLCDTDYSFDRRVTAEDLAAEVEHIMPPGLRDRWVWLTGGEPYDRDLHPLITALRKNRFSIAVATSGVHRAIEPVDWLSVSPHGYNLLQRFGSELKLCDALNDLDISRWISENPDSTTDFFMRYVQPLTVDGIEVAESLQRCLDFLKLNPNWSLSRQDHHNWELP